MNWHRMFAVVIPPTNARTKSLKSELGILYIRHYPQDFKNFAPMTHIFSRMRCEFCSIIITMLDALLPDISIWTRYYVMYIVQVELCIVQHANLTSVETCKSSVTIRFCYAIWIKKNMQKVFEFETSVEKQKQSPQHR